MHPTPQTNRSIFKYLSLNPAKTGTAGNGRSLFTGSYSEVQYTTLSLPRCQQTTIFYVKIQYSVVKMCRGESDTFYTPSLCVVAELPCFLFLEPVQLSVPVSPLSLMDHPVFRHSEQDCVCSDSCVKTGLPDLHHFITGGRLC